MDNWGLKFVKEFNFNIWNAISPALSTEKRVFDETSSNEAERSTGSYSYKICLLNLILLLNPDP